MNIVRYSSTSKVFFSPLTQRIAKRVITCCFYMTLIAGSFCIEQKTYFYRDYSFRWMRSIANLIPYFILLGAIAFKCGFLIETAVLVSCLACKHLIYSYLGSHRKMRSLVFNEAQPVRKLLKEAQINRKALISLIKKGKANIDDNNIETAFIIKSACNLAEEEVSFNGNPRELLIWTTNKINQFQGLMLPIECITYFRRIYKIQKKCGNCSEALRVFSLLNRLEARVGARLRRDISSLQKIKKKTSLWQLEKSSRTFTQIKKRIERIKEEDLCKVSLEYLFNKVAEVGSSQEMIEVLHLAKRLIINNKKYLYFLTYVAESAKGRRLLKREIKEELKAHIRKMGQKAIFEAQLIVFALRQLEGNAHNEEREVIQLDRSSPDFEPVEYRVNTLLLRAERYLYKQPRKVSLKCYEDAKGLIRHFISNGRHSSRVQYIFNKSYLDLAKIEGTLYSVEHSWSILNEYSRRGNNELDKRDKLDLWVFLLRRMNNAIRVLTAIEAIENNGFSIPPYSMKPVIESYLNAPIFKRYTHELANASFGL